MESRYNKRGVSAQKGDVHEAIEKIDKGIIPHTFCKILPDHTGNDPDYCSIMHADTAGTKSSLAYLYWKESGDLTVWEGLSQDAIVMNIDDMLCVGAVDNIIISSTIGRNRMLIPKEVIKSLIEGTSNVIKKINSLGTNLSLAGGETADVGDIVRTLDVGITAFTRMKKKDVITVNIKPENVIIGLSSFGKATYEEFENSGIGSNGLTAARHDLLTKKYFTKYPESFDPEIDEELAYCGKHDLTDVDEQTGLPFGKLLLSPTRTYLPIVKEIIAQHHNSIHGLIHCTGGGQTKVLKFTGQAEKVHIVKDQLFTTPHIFQLIQRSSKTDWREMYQVFNMGHRMEIYTDKQSAAPIIAIAEKYNVDAKIIGHCTTSDKDKLTIESDQGKFEYE